MLYNAEAPRGGNIIGLPGYVGNEGHARNGVTGCCFERNQTAAPTSGTVIIRCLAVQNMLVDTCSDGSCVGVLPATRHTTHDVYGVKT